MAEAPRKPIPATGGTYHPLDDWAQVLREGLAAVGFESTVNDDMDQASLLHPLHPAILQRSALWAVGPGVALQTSRNQGSAWSPT